MKLVTFTESAHTRIGLLQGDHVIDLSKVAPTLPRDMLSLLRSGDAGMQEVAQYQHAIAHYHVSDVILEAPMKRPKGTLDALEDHLKST